MRTIDEIVATNVVLRMKELGLNQSKLAQLVGVTGAYMNKLVNGKKPISKSPNLIKIAEVFKCTEIDLYQDPLIINEARAQATADANANANLKRAHKILLDEYVESMAEMKAAYKASDEASILSTAEQQLLKVFRSLAPAGQRLLLKYAATSAGSGKVRKSATRIAR